MPHDPDSEILPPHTATAVAQPYAPGEPADAPAHSEWDPRSAPGTYTLLAVNVAVYLWMLASGVNWLSPTSTQLMHFGANQSIYVLNGDWYRLLTATFVHIGIIHIGTNLWCLWNLGLLGEPLLGPMGLIAVYVLTGISGNLLSLFWDVWLAHWYHLPLETVANVGAGASGAVFGIAGILIVLLSNKRLPIPWTELKRLRTSVVRFAVINLIIGGATIFGGSIRIDNSAHLGGFASGLALGPGLLTSMTAGRKRYLGRQRIVFLAAAFILALIGYGIANMR